MTWYGEYLWRADLPGAGNFTYQVCGTDQAGNEMCSAEQTTGASGGDAGPEGDAGDGGGGGGGGCCGAAGHDPRGTLLLAVLFLAALRRRRRAPA
jgi:uncharacterized protein (TIGR03382 family)